MSNGLTPDEMATDIWDRAREKLSDWERKFVGDIRQKLQKGWSLSDKQIAKLETIHQDYVD